MTALHLKSVGDVDQVWSTCCGLHNWLLEVDGYPKLPISVLVISPQKTSHLCCGGWKMLP